MNPITYGEVFAGIGSANAAFQPLGWKNKYFIENKATALLQYLFNWDDEFYGGVLSSYRNNLPLNLSDTGTYRRLLKMAVEYQSPEKKGDLYVINKLLNPQNWFGDPALYWQLLENLTVDVAMTSPPCQSFSIAGKKGNLADAKGDLFFETHNFLQLTRPKVFILENVPGMMMIKEKLNYDTKALDYAVNKFGKNSPWSFLYRTNKKLFSRRHPSRETFYDIILPSLGVSANTIVYPPNQKIFVWRAVQGKVVELNPLPYHLKFMIVGAPSFGSPMQRQRVFIVGFRKDLDSSSFKFNIPRIKNKGVLAYINPDARLTRSFRYNLYAPGSIGETHSANATKMIDNKGFHYGIGSDPYIPTLLTKEDPRKLGIKMSSGRYRSLADEQMRALMGFPPGFSSSIVSYSAAVLHFGNSIFVPALNHIGQQIEKVLKKNP